MSRTSCLCRGATPQNPFTVWTYNPYGKRVRKSANPATDGTAQPEIYFYGITGQKLATFTSQWDGYNRRGGAGGDILKARS